MGTLNVTDINLSGSINELRGADIASAATVNLGAATGNLVHITGTTTITSLGTAAQAGIRRIVIFDDSLTLTYGASSIMLQGRANIVTATGDMAEFVSDSTSKWTCVSYTRAATAPPNRGIFVAKRYLTTVAGGTNNFYTATAGTKRALVQMWGAGGAGGGTSAVAGSAGGGGGAGGYAEYEVEVGSFTFTYQIGGKGVGVSGAAGGAGGNTTFADAAAGITITAYGGSGGTFAAGTAAIKYTAGGAGGVISTNGNFNSAGEHGFVGMTSTVVTVGKAGNGGITSLGGNGRGGIYSTAVLAAGTSAIASTGSGGGGSGTGAATASAGGDGADGIIIITEYR